MRKTLSSFLLLVLLTFCFSSYGQMEFVENKGQWHENVKFKADFQLGSFFLEQNGFTVLMHDAKDYEKLSQNTHGKNVSDKSDPSQNFIFHSFAYKVKFLGSAPSVVTIPEKPLSTYNNYFIGNDESKWAGGCKIFQAILYKNVYPKIDVRYYTDAGRLKYDFLVHPGGNPSQIALLFDGPSLSIEKNDLVIKTPVGIVKELYPYSYQPLLTGRETVKAKYVIRNNVVTFNLDKYDPTVSLVIDPSVIFSSFTGSSADNWGFTATPGPDGSFYAGGISFGAGYPTSPGAFQAVYNGGVFEDGWAGYDIALFKFSPTGTNRLYATYLGGSGNEQPHSMIVDAQGNLIVAGRSFSSNYPVRNLAPIGPGGNYDIVITKFNSTGTGLIGSVMIGGSQDDGVNIRPKYRAPFGADAIRRNYGDDARSEVILDGANNIILASCSQSSNFPVLGTSLNQPAGFGGGRQDGVILKFNPNLSARLFSTFFGGQGDDACFVASINPLTGNLYIGGGTTSTNLPGDKSGVLAGGGSFQGGLTDGFVTQIRPDGSAIIKTLYLGTPDIDMIYGLKFDRAGFPYVMGTTTGSWPVINVNFSNPGSKQFVSKLRPDFSGYVYSTIFGTSIAQPNISPVAFLVDRCENVYVSGWGGGINTEQNYSTGTTLGMAKVNPLSATFAPDDGMDFYFFVLEKNGQSQMFGSHFGQRGGVGDHVDGGTSRFDDNGIIYQGICANCGHGTPFPTTTGVWSPGNGSNNCNQAAVKIEMNFSGLHAALQASINGVKYDTKGCVPFTVYLLDTVGKGKKFYWDFGDGRKDTTGVPTDSVKFSTTGQFVVMLIAEDSSTCNIRDTAYITITAGNNQALLNFNSRKLPPCESLTFEFTNTSVPTSGNFSPAAFSWDFGDGSPIVVAPQNPPIQHIFPSPGTYQVTLKLLDTSFCNAPDQLQKTIRINSLVRANFNTNPQGCVPYNALFENTSDAGIDFIWEFGDGTTSTDPSIFVTHNYPDTGSYRVRLIAFDSTTCNKADTSAYFTIRVNSNPTARFSWAPDPPLENTPVRFTNLSVGAVRYLWYFGDGDSSTDVNPEHLYNATGTYTAELIAFNEANCPDTFSLPVNVVVLPLLDVPTAFTPGRFGTNSHINVRGFGIDKMMWRIYNRWGQVVFESTSIKLGWDGNYKGKAQPMDVYAYTLDAEFTDGKKLRRTGDITLLR